MKSASSSVLLILLAVSTGKPEVNTCDWITQNINLVAALLILCGSLSIPRQPDKYYRGKIIDRQQSASIIERLTFSWSGALFDRKSRSLSGVADLPALDHETRTQHLTQHYLQTASSTQARLMIVLAKDRAGFLVAQWTLTILKSVVALAPQYVIFRLLDCLDNPHEDADMQELHLAFSLGLCKALELWISSLLQWITASALQIPIQATLSALVYRKALRLPNSLGDSLNSKENQAEAPQKSFINHLRIDRHAHLQNYLFNMMLTDRVTAPRPLWHTPRQIVLSW